MTSRIEELPDDFDQSLDLQASELACKSTSTSNTNPSAASQSAPFPIVEQKTLQDDGTPQLPPHMASVRSHTADDIVKMMNRTPLFMTTLEDAGEEHDQNVELEAIRALQYEGTPAEIAQGFKEQGNEMTKLKRWKDGKEFYNKAISVISQNNANRLQSPPTNANDEAEVRKEHDLNETCHLNRALCNLELKNYRSTILDCAVALRLNPKNVKAYYRSASALLALDRLREAGDACTRGLTLDSENSALRTLEGKIQTRGKSLIATQRRRQEEAEQERKEKFMLATALRARKIRVRNTTQKPDLEDAVIHLAPDPLSPTSVLQFPVVLLYPLHAQSDFIKAFSELDTVTQHLEYIFPLPWDTRQEYAKGNTESYMETSSGGLVKVGRSVTLGAMLGSDGVEVVDGVVRINVVPKARSASWIKEMKARKGR
ncbi:HSP70/90 co-chaperone [Lecanora helva]